MILNYFLKYVAFCPYFILIFFFRTMFLPFNETIALKGVDCFFQENATLTVW